MAAAVLTVKCYVMYCFGCIVSLSVQCDGNKLPGSLPYVSFMGFVCAIMKPESAKVDTTH